MSTTTSHAAARFGRIPDATARSGLSRSAIYELAAKNPGLFRKYGAATVVDLEHLDRVIAGLPAADIGVRAAEELIGENI